MLIADFTKQGEEIELEELWQYDYGQKLQICGLNLPDAFEVHFSWTGLENAKVVTGHTENGVSTVDIPNEALKQKRAITAYIYLSTAEEGETVNTVMMFVNKRPAPEGLEIPEDVDLFHYTLVTAAEYLKQTKEASNEANNNVVNAEAWVHGHSDFPDRAQDNAKYYAEQAEKEAASVPGRVEKGKKDIDKYVQQKELELKGDTGNVFFAAFKVVGGRLKMYSDPAVDKVCFRREGSRLKYRLKF